jgi:hypothetical protein
MNKVLYNIVAVFYCFSSFAQIAQDSVSKTENLYYKSTLDDINIKFDIDSNNERFEVNNSSFDYDIRPNFSIASRLFLNYKFLSFSYSYIPKFIPGNNDNDLKGKTKGKSFGLNLNFNHWVQELKYGNVKGFYIENSGDFENPWIEGKTPYIQFPDLKVTSFSGSTSYKFNSNFSLKAISTQTEIQLRSAGSFIPGLIYSFYNIDNKSSSQNSSQRSETYEILTNFGYYYTFVLNKNWYASAGISPSIGFSYTDLLTRLPQEYVYTHYASSVYRINGKGGVGYNSERFFAGFEISAFRSFKDDTSPAVKLTTTNNAFQVFLGYRFKAPAKVKEFVKKVETKIPL